MIVLVVIVVLVLASLALLGFLIVSLYRTAREFGREVAAASDRFSQASAGLERPMENESSRSVPESRGPPA